MSLCAASCNNGKSPSLPLSSTLSPCLCCIVSRYRTVVAHCSYATLHSRATAAWQFAGIICKSNYRSDQLAICRAKEMKVVRHNWNCAYAMLHTTSQTQSRLQSTLKYTQRTHTWSTNVLFTACSSVAQARTFAANNNKKNNWQLAQFVRSVCYSFVVEVALIAHKTEKRKQQSKEMKRKCARTFRIGMVRDLYLRNMYGKVTKSTFRAT